MNKSELIATISEKTNFKRKDVETTINTFWEVISDSLVKGEAISFIGIGTFSTKQRAARQARNPKTGDTIDIPATIVPHFSAGKVLKEKVKNALHSQPGKK